MEIRLIKITDDDFKEIFSLFTSVTKYELKQIYDDNEDHYFKNVKLEDEYELSEEKKEYAIDSYRAIFYWLKRNGFRIEKNGQIDNLDWIYEDFFD